MNRLDPPINSTDYEILAPEYLDYFSSCVIRPKHQATVDWYSAKIEKGKERYSRLGDRLNGIPWYFIGILHGLEASFSFETHLHNGDSLEQRTVHVPKGRPKNGKPPFSWEESAEDALVMKGYHQQTDWSLPRLLYRFERYNGFGYRPRHVPTPYLWSFSTHYTKGKYTSDGHFDPNAVSHQCGAAVSLKDLKDKGIITLSTSISAPHATSFVRVKKPRADSRNPAVDSASFRITLFDAAALRNEPALRSGKRDNTVALLPAGHAVRVFSRKTTGRWRQVETVLHGTTFQGFVQSSLLESASGKGPVFRAETDVVAVYMPHKPGAITRRVDRAGATSLNEPSQPGRTGTTAEVKRKELDAIIDWLNVEKASHKRYRPVGGATFCNIYAHDYCHLAGVYLPRVWWTPKAIAKLLQHEPVEPKYEDTIDEVRANDIFRWFSSWFERFDWRRVTDLNALQDAANEGGIGIIVARRKVDGRSGHIVAVVPETIQEARRDSQGNVIAPLQSQAGSNNFRRGTGTLNWWKGDQFAESAFWVHV